MAELSVSGEKVSVIDGNTSDSTDFKIPPCFQFFEKWRFCVSSKNQFHQYYIYGKFKDCMKYKDDLQNCIMYKITKSEETKVSLQEALTRDEPKFTSKSIWEKRENPSDFWNKETQEL